MIEARGLVKRYRSVAAVDNLSFDVQPGTVTGFLGPNGAGKSTTMRMIIGLDRPDAGQVRIGGKVYAEFAAGLVGVAMLVLGHEHWTNMSAASRASFDPVNDSYTGLALGQLLFGALGVLAISTEFGSGLIRATFAAVPARPRVLAAKAAVLAAVTLAAGEICAFAAYAAGQVMLKSPAPHATLGQPGVLRAVLMAGAYPALIALTGLGFGALIRHTAGAICAVVGITFGLLCLYAAVALGAGALALARRDA
jgi:energy-coupling factor transporter ATP-binding protein EcfA2